MLSPGSNPSSTGTTASSAVGELTRMRRSAIVRVSAATPAARPPPDAARDVDCRRADPRGFGPRGLDPRRVDPLGEEGLRRDSGCLTCGAVAEGVVVVDWAGSAGAPGAGCGDGTPGGRGGEWGIRGLWITRAISPAL
jgi:hypothetical protein